MVLPYFFFFNDTATTEIYTLSLTTLFRSRRRNRCRSPPITSHLQNTRARSTRSDRKSTRLNSSHSQNLVCRLLLEKKKKEKQTLNQLLKILTQTKHADTYNLLSHCDVVAA